MIGKEVSKEMINEDYVAQSKEWYLERVQKGMEIIQKWIIDNQNYDITRKASFVKKVLDQMCGLGYVQDERDKTIEPNRWDEAIMNMIHSVER
jgi:hypothetical protein